MRGDAPFRATDGEYTLWYPFQTSPTPRGCAIPRSAGNASHAPWATFGNWNQ